MHMSLPREFAVNRFETRDLARPLAAEPVSPPMIRRMRLRLKAWRWRKAPPFEQLNDHLRRDIGLEPLVPRGARRCGG